MHHRSALALIGAQTPERVHLECVIVSGAVGAPFQSDEGLVETGERFGAEGETLPVRGWGI